MTNKKNAPGAGSKPGAHIFSNSHYDTFTENVNMLVSAAILNGENSTKILDFLTTRRKYFKQSDLYIGKIIDEMEKQRAAGVAPDSATLCTTLPDLKVKIFEISGLAPADGNWEFYAETAVEALERIFLITVFEKLKTDISDFSKTPDEFFSEVMKDRPLKLKARKAVTMASELESKEISWLARPFFALGALHLVASLPGRGKTSIVMHVAARLTLGLPLLPKSQKIEPASILVLSSEESMAHVIKPRFERFGADLSKIGFIDDCDILAIQRFHEAKKELENISGCVCKMLIVDSLDSFLSGTETNNSAAVKTALRPLLEFAECENICVIGIMHSCKATTERSAIAGINGSIAFVAMSRIACEIIENPETGKKFLATVKNNYGRVDAAYEFTIEDHNGNARVIVGEFVEKSADVLRAEIRQAENSGLRADAGGQREVLEVLNSKFPAAVDFTEIAKTVGKTPEQTRGILKRLKQHGLADNSIVGRGLWVARRQLENGTIQTTDKIVPSVPPVPQETQSGTEGRGGTIFNVPETVPQFEIF